MTRMTVDAARELAQRAHEGQVDKVGQPYFAAHVEDVHRRVVAAGGDEDQQVAALLHDVLEDTAVTEEELLALGVSDAALRIVRLMTKTGGDEAAYLAAISAHPQARLVKLADIASNTDPVRVARLDPATRQRLQAKYARYLAALGQDPAAQA